jgi:Gpi18-like mannosyltransferase
VTAGLTWIVGSESIVSWPVTGRDWLDTWGRWDGSWYLNIAVEGYHYVQGQQSNVGFFPLYPLLMRLFSLGSNDLDVVIVAGLIISNVAALLAFYFLYRLILLDHGPDIGRRAIWLLAFFPTSFYLSIVYTEGIFLAFTVTAFYAARKRHWLAAGFLGALGALTRAIGVLLVLPLAWEWYVQKPRRWTNALSLLLIPLGLGAHMLYLGRTFGDPFAYSAAQSNWGRSTSISVMLGYIDGLIADPATFLRGRGVTTFDALFLLLAILLIIVVFRRQRLSYGIYATYTVAMPLSSFLTTAIPRYAMVAFPFYIALAQVLNRPIWFRLVLFAMAALQIFLVVRWTLGYWVA